jgi:hypothetical protein
MERHLAAMADWADLAGEIIVVDSRSADGTLDYIRANLRHPGLRVIERERGLYASWNEGISATSGRWVYISTAGETITRSHLLLMLEKGEATQADVVISPSDYVDESGQPTTAARKKPWIYAELADQGDVLMTPPAARHYAFRAAGTHALLGSCASDLFRGDFLRGRPFPQDYGTHGDTAWLLRHSHEMKLCVLQEVGSTFCLHAPTNAESKESRAGILDQIHANEIAKGGMTPVLTSSIRLRALMRQRRNAWRGWPTTFAWIGATLRYLKARLRHNRLEAAERRLLSARITKAP